MCHSHFNSIILPSAAALAVVIATGSQAQADLIGDTITVSSNEFYFPITTTATATVGPGIEFSARPSLFMPPDFFVDFGANDMVITAANGFAYSNIFAGMTFTNTSNPFESVSLIHSDLQGFNQSNVSVSGGKLTVRIPDNTHFHPGESARYAIPAIPVPEPTTWLLTAVAAGLLGMPRKKSWTMTCLLAMALAILVLVPTPAVQAEILDGQIVRTRIVAPFPHGLTGPEISVDSMVGPGAEIMSDIFYLDVDFSDTNILITNTDQGDAVYFANIEFKDAHGTIPRFTSVTVNPASTWPGYTPSTQIGFNANSIFLFLMPSFGLKGQQLSLDLTAIIPEPATWVLAAVASAFLALRRRRSRRLPEKFAVGLPLAAAIAIRVFIAGPACAQSYRATLLHPVGFASSVASGNSAGNQVGYGDVDPSIPFAPHALLWQSTAESVIDLHPAGFQNSIAPIVDGSTQFGYAYQDDFTRAHAHLWQGTPDSAVNLHPPGFLSSYINDVSAGSQVGHGFIAGETHALLWHGTAESVVDLHPAGFVDSQVRGISGTTQVGVGYTNDRAQHALMWHGTPQSVIDLHPAGFANSNANKVSEGTQVGVGWTDHSHALLWRGTAESVVDLHPAGFELSFADFISGDTQIGSGTLTSGGSHALLWHGTAESVVDLNPAGFDESRVSDVSGNRQVGYASGGTTHAMLWTGTANSAVDLHQYLSELGIAFTESRAHGIAENGDIVGRAEYQSGKEYAVLWKLVPEPSTGVLFCCGLLAAACIRRRARWSTVARQPHSTAAGQRQNKLPALLCKSAFLCALFGWIVMPSAASGALIVFDNEAAFLAAADVVSTETFNEFPTQTLLGRPSATVDGVTYTAINPPPDDIPSPPWGWGWFAGPTLYFSQYRDLTVLSFREGMVSTAIGFYVVGPTSPVGRPLPEYTFTVRLRDDTEIIEQTAANGTIYRGFLASERIKSIAISTITDDGSSHNFDLDNVSRSAIVPAIPEPTTWLLAAIAGISFSIGKRLRL